MKKINFWILLMVVVFFSCTKEEISPSTEEYINLVRKFPDENETYRFNNQGFLKNSIPIQYEVQSNNLLHGISVKIRNTKIDSMLLQRHIHLHTSTYSLDTLFSNKTSFGSCEKLNLEVIVFADTHSGLMQSDTTYIKVEKEQ